MLRIEYLHRPRRYPVINIHRHADYSISFWSRTFAQVAAASNVVFCFCTLVGASLVILPGTALTVGGLHLLRRWFCAGINIRWRDCLFGAALGAWSHVALDVIMHSDVEPLAPWRGDNPLLGVVSMHSLHYGCLVAAIVGMA
jgi:membrane-bound metal-dependent hydrolase YbcI (DUF457 family)